MMEISDQMKSRWHPSLSPGLLSHGQKGRHAACRQRSASADCPEPSDLHFQTHRSLFPARKPYPLPTQGLTAHLGVSCALIGGTTPSSSTSTPYIGAESIQCLPSAVEGGGYPLSPAIPATGCPTYVSCSSSSSKCVRYQFYHFRARDGRIYMPPAAGLRAGGSGLGWGL